jgi:hypothetical protein
MSRWALLPLCLSAMLSATGRVPAALSTLPAVPALSPVSSVPAISSISALSAEPAIGRNAVPTSASLHKQQPAVLKLEPIELQQQLQQPVLQFFFELEQQPLEFEQQ